MSFPRKLKEKRNILSYLKGEKWTSESKRTILCPNLQGLECEQDPSICNDEELCDVYAALYYCATVPVPGLPSKKECHQY